MLLPSVKFLKTFQVAAKLQSFKAAAEELFVTPSAVSHQMKALEDYLGVALFERGVRTLTLTDAGTYYLEHINDLFAKLESVTDQLRVRYGRSIIRVNVPPFFATELLLPRLASFSQPQEESDIRIETTFSASKTHPAEADRSIVGLLVPNKAASAAWRARGGADEESGALQLSSAGAVISNCNFTSHPLVIEDNLFMAIRAVSDAAAANAKAIERIADRLCGANDNRNCIFGSSAERKEPK